MEEARSDVRVLFHWLTAVDPEGMFEAARSSLGAPTADIDQMLAEIEAGRS